MRFIVMAFKVAVYLYSYFFFSGTKFRTLGPKKILFLVVHLNVEYLQSHGNHSALNGYE